MLQSLVNAANVEVSFKVWEVAVMVATVIGLVLVAKAYINGNLHLFESED